MNRRRHRFDKASEQEWTLQERAFAEERDANGSGDADEDVAAYRHVVRALRQPTSGGLPSNFAYVVASLAARLPKASRLDLRLEQWLVRMLVTAMVVGGLVVAAVFGRDWLLALDAQGPGAGAWIATALACMALTWGIDALRRWQRLS